MKQNTKPKPKRTRKPKAKAIDHTIGTARPRPVTAQDNYDVLLEIAQSLNILINATEDQYAAIREVLAGNDSTPKD